MAQPKIDEHLARRLVDRQFPRWAGLPIARVEPDGHDNRTFRLGPELTVRLPSGEWYALQVEKEQRWLPFLAPRLPLPIPAPVAEGVPGDGYPYPWSVYRWLDGEVATEQAIGDLSGLATELARFLVALQDIDATGGPGPGRHNFHRGGPLATYADETMRAIESLADEIARAAVQRAWEQAMASTWDRDPVWLHGDMAAGNLLLRGGELAAVIDFGCAGVGDPACDLAIAFTLLFGPSRDAFRTARGADPSTWARGRGWALWKALITLAGDLERDDADAAAVQRRVIDRVLADHAGER